jgi:hypothetical protein
VIGPVDLSVIRVRAVEGRRIDPFRGELENSATIHCSRTGDTQPFADVLALLQGMALVKVERTGRRLVLARADESLKVAFVSAAPRVSLDDLVLEGDGRLALAVMHALLPMFGPVEIRIGRYEDLVDGHEPLASVLERYDNWFVEDSLRVAKKLNKEAAKAAEGAGGPIAGGAPKSTIGAHVVERARTKDKSQFTKAALLALAVLVVIIGGGAIWKGMTKVSVGEHCDRNKDCDSNQCLPNRSVNVSESFGLLTTSSSPDVDPNNLDGVCTVRCTDDADCPTSMACMPLVETGGLIAIPSRTWGCAPRAWDGDLAPTR